MAATVSDIIHVLDNLAPPSLAEEWDNIGLQVGDPTWSVQNIWIALDAGFQVVDSACRRDIDLLITHHPLIFKPLKTINFNTPVGSIIELATHHHLAIFAAHTNLDNAMGGGNDILARRIGLDDLKPLVTAKVHNRFQYDVYPLMSHEQGPGIGRVGRLDHAMDLKSFALMIKKKLGLKFLKLVGNPALSVETVAVCTGSGSSLMSNFISSGAQAYISGDLRYHDARDVQAANLGMIDIGHFPSEHLIVDVLAQQLNTLLVQSQLDVTVEACDLEKDPFTVL